MSGDVFEQMEVRAHEQVVFCHEASCGLKAIIAIHDTTLGPALGGARLWNYGSEAAALKDALRLSKAMTYKAAVAGLGLGGGKAVIIADPEKKTEALRRVSEQMKSGPDPVKIPITGIQPTDGGLTWYLDRDAAGIAD